MQSERPGGSPPIFSVVALLAPVVGIVAAHSLRLVSAGVPDGDTSDYGVAWRYVLFATPAAMAGAILAAISILRRERYYGIAVAALAINLPAAIHALLLGPSDFPAFVLLVPPILLLLGLGLAGGGIFKEVKTRRHTSLMGLTLMWWAAGFELYKIGEPSWEIEAVLVIMIALLLASGARLMPQGAAGLLRALRCRDWQEAARSGVRLALASTALIPLVPFALWYAGYASLLGTG